MTDLPTRDQMLDDAAGSLQAARDALNDAAAWLRSDWQPVGSALTGEQAARRLRMRAAITIAKGAIVDALEGRDPSAAREDW